MRTPARANFRAKKTAPFKFPSPTNGWISNQNISSPDEGVYGARILDNYAVTPRDIVLRRGKQRYATFGDETLPIVSMWTYNNGDTQKMFAANRNEIWDVSSPESPENSVFVTDTGDTFVDNAGNTLGTNSLPSGAFQIGGFSSGDWITTQFATTGGVFTVAVNAINAMLIYDGDRWYQVSSADISVVPIDTVVGTFQVGESVTGSTSGAVGSILYVDSDKLTVRKSSSASFQDNETITGGTSGATALANGDEQLYFLGLTGVDTRVFCYVWSFKGRLFFLERDSMNVWYLDIDAIGGKAELFPMGGLFPSGGYLMFGASWSMDSSGDGGLSAQCIFVSSLGEVVVYQGINPSLADQWSYVGLYRVGSPRGPRAHIRSGADIVIATDIGAIPLTQAVQRDLSILSEGAASYAIDPDWQEAVEKRPLPNWIMHQWLENKQTFVCLPKVQTDPHMQFVSHGNGGTWSRYTGWEITAITTFTGRLYAGWSNGRISQLYTSGLDEDLPYTGVVVPLFTDMGTSLQLKMARIARVVTKGPFEVQPKINILYDDKIDLPTPPNAVTIGGQSSWGTAIWGSSVWGESGTDRITQKWVPVSGRGYSISPSSQITSGSIAPMDVHIVRIEVTFETGDIVS